MKVWRLTIGGLCYILEDLATCRRLELCCASLGRLATLGGLLYSWRLVFHEGLLQLEVLMMTWFVTLGGDYFD